MGNVIYASGDSFGFFPGCVRCKGEQTVSDVSTDFGCCQPATFVNLLLARGDKLAGYHNVLVSIGGSVFLKQPGSLLVKLKLHSESTRSIDHFCFFYVPFSQKWIFSYGEAHRIMTIHFDAVGMAHPVGWVWLGFKVQPDRGQEDTWNREYERHLFHQAAAQIRSGLQDATWQAFWQTAVEGKGAKEVSDCLNMTVAAVYLAKSRVMAKLKEQVQQLAAE